MKNGILTELILQVEPHEILRSPAVLGCDLAANALGDGGPNLEWTSARTGANDHAYWTHRAACPGSLERQALLKAMTTWDRNGGPADLH